MTRPVELDQSLHLEGCLNFRDLGGYESVEGGRVVERSLFRSDSLSRLTDLDVELLSELGIASVIDLRSPDEVTRLPGRRPASTRLHHLPVFELLPDVATYVTWVDPAVVSQHYLDMLEEGASSFAAALDVLSDPRSYPAMFHCAVGKDRTGVLAAVVLGLLGVAPADIVSDYVKSESAMQIVIGRLRNEATEELHPGRLAALTAVDASIMEGFITGVTDRYGSFDQLARHLGHPNASLRLREALVR
jgi:protein-tyrosine phosphatase